MHRPVVYSWCSALALGCLLISCAHGECIPLPSSELRAIDRYADIDPKKAIAAANRFLAQSRPADPLIEAQAYAVIADADIYASRPREVRSATAIALEKLSHVSKTPTSRQLEARLKIAAITAASESNDNAAAVKDLDSLMAELPAHSVEQSCALEARAEAYTELNRNDRAAADATAAYRIAEEGGWTNARIQSAFALAIIYGRAGVLSKSLAMSDEVVAIAKAEGRTLLLAMAEYSRGRILLDAGEFAGALEAFEIARVNAQAIGDQVGVASANFSTCMTLVRQENLAEADRTCDVRDSDFVAAQRSDLLIGMQAVRARLLLLHGRPGLALRTLNSILTKPSKELVPYLLPTLYRDQATALSALGNYTAAYHSLQQANAIEAAADRARQSQAVAVLEATTAAEKLMSRNEALNEKLQTQAVILDNQRNIRVLWAVFLSGASLLCVLLIYLLLVARRQSNKLKRNEATFLAYVNNAPEALVVINSKGLVRFSNRHIFGRAGLVHPTDQPLSDGNAERGSHELTSVVEQVLVKMLNAEQTATVSVGGNIRYFALQGSPIMDGTRLLGGILRSTDITALRQLELEVIEVSRRERQRLSSELHEGMGQVLTGVLLLLRSLLTQIDRGQSVSRKTIVEIHEHIENSLIAARDIARGISPIEVARGSLTDALRRLAEESSRRFGLPVTVQFPELLSIPGFAAEQLYHIASEAITNAARHSGCTSIQVALVAEREAIELAIIDNGHGIDLQRTGLGGYGMKLMAYYARVLGGRISFQAAPDRGTSVRVTISESNIPNLIDPSHA